MFSSLRILAAPVVALGFLAAFASTAGADTVQYHVQGHFDVTGATASGGETLGTATVGGGQLDNQLTFTPSGKAITFAEQTFSYSDTGASSGFFFPMGEWAADFGKFTSSGSFTGTFSGVKFELDVFQELPDPTAYGNNTNAFVGKASGTLVLVAGTLQLKFDAPYSFVIPNTTTSYPPGIVYHIDENVQSLALGSGQIRGTLAAAPLPGVAMGGLWILGGIGSFGGLKALRRRMGAVLA